MAVVRVTVIRVADVKTKEQAVTSDPTPAGPIVTVAVVAEVLNSNPAGRSIITVLAD